MTEFCLVYVVGSLLFLILRLFHHAGEIGIGFEVANLTVFENQGFVEVCVFIDPNQLSDVATIEFQLVTDDGTATGKSVYMNSWKLCILRILRLRHYRSNLRLRNFRMHTVVT